MGYCSQNVNAIYMGRLLGRVGVPTRPCPVGNLWVMSGLPMLFSEGGLIDQSYAAQWQVNDDLTLVRAINSKAGW